MKERENQRVSIWCQICTNDLEQERSDSCARWSQSFLYFFEEVGAVKFRGRLLPCPSAPASYLGYHYGDWQTPKRSLSTSTNQSQSKWRRAKALLREPATKGGGLLGTNLPAINYNLLGNNRTYAQEFSQSTDKVMLKYKQNVRGRIRKELFMRLFNIENKVKFVSGFWSLSNNPKHSSEDFAEWIPRTVNAVCPQNGGLVFFHQESASFSFLSAACGHPQGLEPVVLESIDQIWPGLFPLVLQNARAAQEKYRWAPDIVRALHPPLVFKEKGFRKLFQIRRSSIEEYARLAQIYLSKISLVARAIAMSAEPPSDSEMFAWIDAGFSRQISAGNIPDRGFGLREDRINLIRSPMKYRFRNLKGSGKLIVAPKFQWDWMQTEFLSRLPHLLQGTYLHDDETIIAELWRSNPNRFARLEA